MLPRLPRYLGHLILLLDPTSTPSESCITFFSKRRPITLSSFIRFTSVNLKDANQSQFNVEAFSAKFTCVISSSYSSCPPKSSNSLSGMTGTFNSTIQAQISGLTTASGAPSTAAATGSTRPSGTSAAAASTVKPSAAASSAAGSSKNNGAGHMVVPHVLGATGVAAIIFAFFL